MLEAGGRFLGIQVEQMLIKVQAKSKTPKSRVEVA